MIDVSNPANPVRMGGYDTSGAAVGVALAGNRIHVADRNSGLVVLTSLLNVQFITLVDASPGVPVTIEAATNLTPPIQWKALLTTNVAIMPFDFVDFDVKAAEHPQKFYRAHQP